MRRQGLARGDRQEHQQGQTQGQRYVITFHPFSFQMHVFTDRKIYEAARKILQ